MCGIAGYFGTRDLPTASIEECLRRMNRRGPDAATSRTWTGPSGRRATLLHARLNIIDLDSRANQPFHDESSWLAYNGELYNYVELQKELEARGETFRTTSDTEVFLRLLNRDGLDALDRCEGMWAWALYDEAKGALTLCRDRFGEKPLYLYRDDTGVYFGSEPKFLSALLGRRLEPDLDQLSRFLVNGYKSLYKGRQTFFKGVTEVRAGTWLRLDAQGRETERRYWAPAHRPDDAMTYEAAVKGARERLIESVRLRLRADVPLAFCMSGGVDSNSLISIAKNVFNYDVHGFTIANTDARYEEQAIVEEAVRLQKLRHTSIPVNPDRFLPRLRELVRYHDSPVCTINYYAHWLLMEAVSKHGYRISVSGTSADELFSGYYDHHLAYLYEVRKEPALHAASRAAWESHIKPIVRNPFLRDPDAFVRDPEFRGHIFMNAAEFAACLQKPWAEPFAEERFTGDLLRNRMMNELFHEATPVVLHEDDLNAMYYSIENRSPFLDRGLFDFANTIPTRHLVRDGRAKAVLRDAMKGIVPQVVLESRRKVGFNAPIFSFLDMSDPSVMKELFRDSPVFDLLRKEKIQALLEKEALPNSESKFLFYFLTTKLFLEEFA